MEFPFRNMGPVFFCVCFFSQLMMSLDKKTLNFQTYFSQKQQFFAENMKSLKLAHLTIYRPHNSLINDFVKLIMLCTIGL